MSENLTRTNYADVVIVGGRVRRIRPRGAPQGRIRTVRCLCSWRLARCTRWTGVIRTTCEIPRTCQGIPNTNRGLDGSRQRRLRGDRRTPRFKVLGRLLGPQRHRGDAGASE